MSCQKPGNVQELELVLRVVNDRHIPGLFQQDQLFSVGFQRLIDHYKIFTESNGKWKGLRCCVVAKTRSWCWNGVGLFASRDMNIMVPLLVLGIWIQCMLCFSGQGGSLLMVSA